MNIMNVSLAITLLTMSLLSGCNSKSSNNSTVNEQPQPQVEKFSSLSRAAFAQASTSEPLSLNGLVIENDVTSADFYDDLLMTQ